MEGSEGMLTPLSQVIKENSDRLAKFREKDLKKDYNTLDNAKKLL